MSEETTKPTTKPIAGEYHQSEMLDAFHEVTLGRTMEPSEMVELLSMLSVEYLTQIDSSMRHSDSTAPTTQLFCKILRAMIDHDALFSEEFNGVIDERTLEYLTTVTTHITHIAYEQSCYNQKNRLPIDEEWNDHAG